MIKQKLLAGPSGIEPETPGFLCNTVLFCLKARCSILAELRAPIDFWPYQKELRKLFSVSLLLFNYEVESQAIASPNPQKQELRRLLITEIENG